MAGPRPCRRFVCPICARAPKRQAQRLRGFTWFAAHCIRHPFLSAGSDSMNGLRWAWHHQVRALEQLRSA